ncbi:MAG: DEAD/DEAH box helicase [Bacteriovoracia bacterium]
MENISSADTPLPSWSELGLDPRLLTLLEKAGYKIPSPVQAQSIPAALKGQDVLVSSQTGSGKTASFVLPALQRFIGRDGTYILALAPTREIAQQTGAVFEQFGNELGFRTAVCIGGASIPAEKEALQKSPHVIVATPGRLCDHLERGNVWLEFIQCFILDEADRMLDMGFTEQLNKITEQLPKERQTMLFSATFAPEVEKLARKILHNPLEVTIAKAEGTAPKIDQIRIDVPEHAKLGALMRIMRNEPGTMFVFANSKDKVSQIWRALHSKRIYDVTYIHSDCTQEHREEAIRDFKSGKYRVLIATDVAGRGIDVEDVAHVVNFDIPKEAEDYVHRIGRTGRKGKSGKSTSFVGERDGRQIDAVEKLLGAPIPQERPRDDRPREERPRRDDRPREERPRREDRPRREERAPRDANAPREDRAPRGERPPRADRPPRTDRPPRDENRGPRPERVPVTMETGPDGQPWRSDAARERYMSGRAQRPQRERGPKTVTPATTATASSAPAQAAKSWSLWNIFSWFKPTRK